MSDRDKLSFGINQNVEIDDRVLHVQTEVLGRQRDEILTVVYSAGEIVYSCSHPYGFFRDRGYGNLTVKAMVMLQHRGVVAGMKSGKLLKRWRSSGG